MDLYFVVLTYLFVFYIVQHSGMPSLSFKFIASQASSIYSYKNLREKVQRCCANIYFKQQCTQLGVTPHYARIKVPKTSPTAVVTQRKIQLIRVKEEIKFLYIKNVHFDAYMVINIPHFSIDNAHLMYNAHPKLFRHSF